MIHGFALVRIRETMDFGYHLDYDVDSL
jgi:hypothetical protein